MAHEHAQFATQPVNFNDSSEDDFFNPNSASAAATTHLGAANNNNEDGRKTYNDRSSVLTGWTSGITVPYSVPLNEEGQTHAEAIVHEYSARGSRVGPSPDMDLGTPGGYLDGDRKSVGPVSANAMVYIYIELIYLYLFIYGGQDSAGLSYIDENFRYYSSRGTPTIMNADGTTHRGDSPSDAHDAPLVSNARNIGGANRRDLGAYPVSPHPPFLQSHCIISCPMLIYRNLY
jgi:hypothetical protein